MLCLLSDSFMVNIHYVEPSPLFERLEYSNSVTRARQASSQTLALSLESIFLQQALRQPPEIPDGPSPCTLCQGVGESPTDASKYDV